MNKKSLTNNLIKYLLIVLLTISSIYVIYFTNIKICQNSLKDLYQSNIQIYFNLIFKPGSFLNKFCFGEVNYLDLSKEEVYIYYDFKLYFFISQIIQSLFFLLIIKRSKFLNFIAIVFSSNVIVQFLFNFFAGLNLLNETFFIQNIFFVLLKLIVDKKNE